MAYPQNDRESYRKRKGEIEATPQSQQAISAVPLQLPIAGMNEVLHESIANLPDAEGKLALSQTAVDLEGQQIAAELAASDLPVTDTRTFEWLEKHDVSTRDIIVRYLQTPPSNSAQLGLFNPSTIGCGFRRNSLKYKLDYD